MTGGASTRSGGISLGATLLILFIALKLTGVVAWSWWLVLMPLWAGLLTLVAIGVVILILVAHDNRKRRIRLEQRGG